MAWAAGIAAFGSLVGGERANALSVKEAQKNRDFQARMSSTAHQREVKDLRLAGLNPILSAGGPGASTPSGGQAPISDTITPAISSAMSALQTKADLSVKKANVRVTDANTALAVQNKKNAETERLAKLAQIAKTVQDTRNAKNTADKGDIAADIAREINKEKSGVFNKTKDVAERGYNSALDALNSKIYAPSKSKPKAFIDWADHNMSRAEFTKWMKTDAGKRAHQRYQEYRRNFK